jgi:glycosyltransferase involved in cell wall biosynthesis
MNRPQKKIRVCLMIPKLGIGGAEVQVLEFIKHLDRSRFTISLVTLTAGLKEMEIEASQYLEAFEVAGFRRRRLPVSFVKMVAWLKRGRYDILHCHLPLADAIGRPAGWLAGIPILITTEHGRNLWKPWYYLVVEKMLNRMTDMRICVSQDILEIRNRREHTPLSKLVRIPNAVDIPKFRNPLRRREAVMAEFGWPASDSLVVSVGRLAPEKNYAILVEAVGQLRPRYPQVRCLLAGSGPCRDELLAVIGRLGLGEHVKLAGRRKDIADLLGAADTFVLPSDKEGLPVSVLEAMAAGRAIVVTAVGGMPEVIRDGENGLVVPPGSPGAVAAAIARLMDDGSLRKSLGDTALADAERQFGIDRVTDTIARLYADLFESKCRRSSGRETT